MFSINFNKKNTVIFIFFKSILIISWAVVVLLPFIILLSGALKVNESIYSLPFRWIPKNPSFDNFIYVIKEFKMLNYVFNSIVVMSLTVALQSCVCSLAGYSFARLNFKGRDKIFLMCMFVMMIPYTTSIIPLFIMMNKLKWINTFLPLILPQGLTYAYGVFIIRQFCTYIPNSYEESAFIDGANQFEIFFHIILPLLKPALVSVAILGGIGSWNDFMAPLIYLQDQSKYTTQIALRFFTGQFTSDYPKLLAAVAIAVLPVLALYFMLQKLFISSYMSVGIKG